MSSQHWEVRADDIEMISDQLKANPPDGLVAIEQTEHGDLTAVWTSGGQRCSICKPLRPE